MTSFSCVWEGESWLNAKKKADKWRPDIEEVLDSKLNEFGLLGYPKASKEEIWTCLKERVWKERELFLHEAVADIFSLQPSAYMNYLARKAYKDDDLMASIAALSGNEKQ